MKNYNKNWNGYKSHSDNRFGLRKSKAEKQNTFLKVILSVLLVFVLALGGHFVYKTIQENKVIPPTQQEQQEPSIVQGTSDTTALTTPVAVDDTYNFVEGEETEDAE